MEHAPQARIMPNNGSGWYWEVVTEDRDVIARGIAHTHAQARADAKTRVPAGAHGPKYGLDLLRSLSGLRS